MDQFPQCMQFVEDYWGMEDQMRKLSRRMTIIVASATFAIGIPLGVVIAGASFTDVPPSNPFYNDISALANSGVTGGCGGGNFCPKDNVTREQMAAFLNRLGALQAGKTPVVNADKVDGLQANELIRVAGDYQIVNTGTSPSVGIPSSVTAPIAGGCLTVLRLSRELNGARSRRWDITMTLDGSVVTPAMVLVFVATADIVGDPGARPRSAPAAVQRGPIHSSTPSLPSG